MCVCVWPQATRLTLESKLNRKLRFCTQKWVKNLLWNFIHNWIYGQLTNIHNHRYIEREIRAYNYQIYRETAAEVTGWACGYCTTRQTIANRMSSSISNSIIKQIGLSANKYVQSEWDRERARERVREGGREMATSNGKSIHPLCNCVQSPVRSPVSSEINVMKC